MTAPLDIRRLEREMTERALATLIKAQPEMAPASFPLGRAWFLLCYFSTEETNVSDEIRKLGYDIFSPQQSAVVIRRGRRMVVNSALFPGYMFVSFDRERDDWGLLADIDGVIGILKNANNPVRVPTEEIERLRRAEDAGLFDFSNPSANFTVGQLVEIEGNGPFKGLIARIKSATAKKRVKVLLDTLATITIDPVFLKKISA